MLVRRCQKYTDEMQLKVIKSKSSNTAINTKSEKRNQSRKKSKSNAEFQTLAAKKRGVYVENKRANLAACATETKIDETQPVKPPRRPKPGSKRFLASVLTILSKSTTGTQYPDAADGKKKIKKKTAKDPETTAEDDKKKKPKYRSKILNDNKNQVDKFEVLQSKKEIVQTPSIYSERSYKEDIKWSDLPKLVKPEPEEEEIKVTTINNLVREVTEGKKLKEKKVKIEEPATLVSEHKDDKRLYNFFVDLLETTFSVYNVKAEYDAAPAASGVSSNIALEIDESVARKLNVGTEMYDDVTQKPSKHFYCIRNDNNNWNDKNLIDYFQSTPSSTKRVHELPLKSPGKRRRLTESYAYPRSKISPPQSKSVVITQRKSFYRKNKKADLLNILKEQLRMDHVSFDEPQNLYQALKVMAKNKRKTIRFDSSAKARPGSKPPECMLKRRKIISPSNKYSAKYDSEYIRSTGSISHKFSEVSGYKEYENYSNVSNHSLEVYGFDYEVPYKKRKEEKRKEVFMPYHSSAENSDIEDMKYAEGSSSTIRDFTNFME